MRAALPEALLVFIAPPSWDVLVDRLVGRGTESPDVVERRLQHGEGGAGRPVGVRREVVNDDVQRAAEDLLTLVVGTPRDLHA